MSTIAKSDAGLNWHIVRKPQLRIRDTAIVLCDLASGNEEASERRVEAGV